MELVLSASVFILGMILNGIFFKYQQSTYKKIEHYSNPFKLNIIVILVLLLYLFIFVLISNMLTSVETYFIYLMILCMIVLGFLSIYIGFGFAKMKLFINEVKKNKGTWQ